MKKIYERIYYKYLDLLRKLTFVFQRVRYFFHPNIHLGKNVRLSRGVKLEVVFGGEINIGNNTEIMDGCRIKTYGNSISIGKNCSINPYTVIYGHGGTKIGDNVLIAGHCMIIPSNHIFDNPEKLIRKQGLTEKGIKIESDVWIAHGCSILDNVTIKKGAIIAAGSVVNKTVSSYTINAGVPVREIKKRSKL